MNFEQPAQVKPLDQAINDLYFSIKNKEVELVDTQLEDFEREAKKLDPKFARDLPARGLFGGSLVEDFKFLDYSLKNEFINQHWGSFYIPGGVEEVGDLGGLGYSAKNDGFMLIGKPEVEISRANLVAVLVPRHYEFLIGSLRQAYPGTKFITVDEIKDLPQIVKGEI